MDADSPLDLDDDSIFSGVAEPPEDGAVILDDDDVVPEDLSKEITDSGDLRMRVPVGDIDPFDHSAEHDAVKADKAKLGVAPPDLPKSVPEPVRNGPLMHDSNEALRGEMERRFKHSLGDLDVTVSAEERDAFVRAALFDKELMFDIQLEGVGAVVRVAIPPDEFTNSASAAVMQWGREDFIDKESDMQWLLAFQQIHAWHQVRAINGEPTVWSDFWADGNPPLREIRKAMRDTSTFDDIFCINAARWRLMLDAIRIAELKYKICLQNWRDRSFFAGADIG
jgi:hypothetical protein